MVWRKVVLLLSFYLVLDTQADLICFIAELWQNMSYKNLHILFPKK